MKSGAFQVSREIFENPIWEDVIKFRLFFFIVGNAVFAEEGVTKAGVHIKRGQYLRSYRNLQKDLQYLENRAVKQYSLSVIKKKVDQLVKEKRLKIEDAEPGTLFTVVNYALYQGLSNYGKVTENGARTGRERGENNNKNVKKEKNVKDINNKPIKKGEKDMPKKTKKLREGTIEYAESVRLKPEEFDKLTNELGTDSVQWMLDALSAYKVSNDKYYANDYAVFKRGGWLRERLDEHLSKQKTKVSTSDFLQNKLNGGYPGDRERIDITPNHGEQNIFKIQNRG